MAAGSHRYQAAQDAIADGGNVGSAVNSASDNQRGQTCRRGGDESVDENQGNFVTEAEGTTPVKSEPSEPE